MQQINLYQAQFKPKKVVLPPRQMLLILLLVLIILSVMGLYSAKRNSTFKQIISQQQQHTIQQIDHITESPLLNAELEKLHQQQNEKTKLLDYLTHQDFGNQQGFSETLHSLSKQQISNVWLTEFLLLNGGQSITLQGKSLQSSQIPLYIDSLAESDHFHGEKFSVFQLQQPKDNKNIYTFKLNTDKNGSGRD